jgi:PAS domain S-box-containing protein
MSIRIKITVMFLAVALIPLLVVSALTFTNYKNSLETERLNEMQNIAAFKADKIETYFADMKIYFELGQVAYVIKKSLPVMTRLASDPDNPDFTAARKLIDMVYRNVPSNIGLLDIMLTDPQGRIVYSNNPEHFSKDFLNFLPDPQQKAFREGKDKVYFSDIFFNKTRNNRPGMLITGPARDFNGTFIGVIAAEIDVARVYTIIQDTTGLEKSGETLVGKKISSEVLFLNTLRYDTDAALKKSITLGEKSGIGIQRAARGETGAGQFIDYRGRAVIGAWRYIPSLNWGIVTKMDIEEAFADITKLRNLVIIIFVIIFILSSVVAFSIARSIAEPIKKLSKGAEIIGRGNLDYKVATDFKDEIGQLSRSFDRMVLDLKTTTASRDELNREITERRQAEMALRENEARLSQAVEVGDLGSWGLDARSGTAWRTPRHDQIFGYPELLPEWTYKMFLDHVLPEDRKQVDEKYGNSLADGKDWSFECRIRRSNGAIRWIWAQGKPRYNDRNEVVQLIGLVQDITERKQTEEALRATNEELTRFNQAMVGRELRMVELKKEINELCGRMGLQKRYNLDIDKEQS